MSTSLRLATGNAGHKPLAALLDDFKPDIEIPDSPAWLWAEAKKEWKRITPELEKYGLVSQIDRAALVLYCQAWAEYVWAKNMLSRKMQEAEEAAALARKLHDQKCAAGAIDAPFVWHGGDGFMLPTPNGSFAYSPYWVAARRAGDEVSKYLASFGMSPSARTRVMQSDQYPYLPGMEPSGTAAPSKPTLASFSR